MQYIADILVQGSNGWPIAIVEVKNRLNLTRDVAIALRQSRLIHSLLPQVPYFLLLSQDTGYLWKQLEQPSFDAPPVLDFPMDNVIRRYSVSINTTERLRGPELELLVLRWLNYLTWMSQDAAHEPEKSLAQTGFLAAIQGASVLLDEPLGMAI